MGKKIRSIVVIGLILMILPLNAEATGIAVSPSKIEINDALKGTESERVLTIFNTDTLEDTFSLNATGDISDWISFYRVEDTTMQINTITIPAKDEATVLIKFAIPNDAPKGEYTSKIYVQSIPPEVGGGQAAVMIKMPVDITIKVTGTQILAGVVKSITTGDTEVNHPLRINIEFQNTGNVVARPDIAVKITKDEKIIDEFTQSETGVKVDSKEIIPVEWDTTGRESGDYVANVTVSLGEEVLATQGLQFKLLPVGTLSTQGNLTGISFKGEPSVGKTLKILASFINTGEIDTKAKFIGEVYVDGELVDTISSEELLVPVRETGTLTAYLKIEKDGSYVINGHAVYEGKTTETKELSFVVGTESEPTPKSKPFIPGFGAIGVIIAIASVMGYLICRRKKSVR